MENSWYVIYTKPRNEKKVVEQLTRLGFEVYCPMKTEVRQWSDRKKKVEIPLFNSYCFVKTNEKERKGVYEAQGFSRFVYWLGQPATIKEAEIQTIKRWLNDFSHESITPVAFQKGDKVTIQSGPMMNQEGVVISQRGNQLMLLLPSIGFQLIVSLAAVIVNNE